MEEWKSKAAKVVLPILFSLLGWFAKDAYNTLRDRQQKIEDAINGDYGIRERLSNVEGAIHYSREKNKERATP